MRLLILIMFGMFLGGCSQNGEYQDDGPDSLHLPPKSVLILCRYQDMNGNNLLKDQLPELQDHFFKLEAPLTLMSDEGKGYKNVDSIFLYRNYPSNIQLTSEIFNGKTELKNAGIVKYAIDFSSALKRKQCDTIEVHWSITSEFSVQYDAILLNNQLAPMSKSNSDIPTVLITLK